MSVREMLLPRERGLFNFRERQRNDGAGHPSGAAAVMLRDSTARLAAIP